MSGGTIDDYNRMAEWFGKPQMQPLNIDGLLKNQNTMTLPERPVAADKSPAKRRSMDNVTTTNLHMALKSLDICLSADTVDKIIDLVDLIEQKGDDVSINDILILKKAWKKPSF